MALARTFLLALSAFYLVNALALIFISPAAASLWGNADPALKDGILCSLVLNTTLNSNKIGWSAIQLTIL